MEIRPAQQQDCINLAALSIQVWLNTYAKEGIHNEHSLYAIEHFSEKSFSHYLASTSQRILVCEQNGALCGFVQVKLDSHYQTPLNGYEVEKLYIHPNFMGQGIGKALLNEITALFGSQFWLVTWVENEANGFYRHLGLRCIGTTEFLLYKTKVYNNVYATKTI